MELTDILSKEEWKQLAEEIYEKFGINGGVNDKQGLIVAFSSQWSNEFCPKIKGGEQSRTICAIAHQYLLKEAQEKKEAAIGECVIVNVMRGGPGLGSIQPEQGDYFQAVKGGGHGDYKLIVLAPNSVQEMAEHTILLFNLTDKYRNPGMILTDGYLGQMKESMEFPDIPIEKYEKPWAVTGIGDRETQNIIESLFLAPEPMIETNRPENRSCFRFFPLRLVFCFASCCLIL